MRHQICKAALYGEENGTFQLNVMALYVMVGWNKQIYWIFFIRCCLYKLGKQIKKQNIEKNQVLGC